VALEFPKSVSREVDANRSSMRIVTRTLLLLLLVAGSSRAQDTSAAAGCYRFDRAYFSWVGRRPNDRAVVQDSVRVLRLMRESTADHVFVRGRVMDVLPIPFAADSDTARRWLRPSHWGFVDARTINVVWRNGLYGPVFKLMISGDTLRGQVRFTTDVAGAEPPPESAWAVRIACPGG
jgi:hypothetical protein